MFLNKPPTLRLVRLQALQMKFLCNTYDEKYSKRFNVLDADVILGTGLEYQVGETTKLFGGLSYHRGLVSIDDYYESTISDKIELRNNVISLDLGVKF